METNPADSSNGMFDTPRWKHWKNWNNRKSFGSLGRWANPDKDLRRFDTGWDSVGNATVLEESQLDESAVAMLGLTWNFKQLKCFQKDLPHPPRSFF